MPRITFPERPINGQTLYESLVSAGVRMRPLLPLPPISLDAGTITVEIEDEADVALANAVIGAYVAPPEKTPQQIKQANAEKGFSADDHLAILVRALVLVVVDLQNDNAARVAARQPLRTLTPKQIHTAIRDKFGSLIE